MSFEHLFVLSTCLLLASITVAGSQTRTRRNFCGMHHLRDGRAAIPEGMNWARHLVGKDDDVLGATIFALEISGWFRFNIAPIVDRLAAYVAASR